MRMSRSATASIFGFLSMSIAPSSHDYSEVAANAKISKQFDVQGLIARDTLGVATCEPKVVFCNYAHLYSGMFSWNDVLRGAKSSTVIVMQADIDGLRVACKGTETMTDEGGTKVLKSQGHFDQQTYDQLKTSGGPRIIPGVDLIGDNSYENPAADSVNGVTGTVTVKWNLKRR